MAALGTQTLLVVDDDDDIRELMGEILSDAGFECVPAASGDEARKLIDPACRFALLLSDIKMPGRTDGIELAKHFKSVCPHRPALLVSGNPDGREFPFPVLCKPLNFAQLIHTVRGLLSA